MSRFTDVFLAAALTGAGVWLMGAQTQNQPRLTQVYENNEFQITGVTVSKSGRLFVNFPRWSDQYLNAVVEVMKDGSVKPYPDEFWNRWDRQPGSAWQQFVCVQSVVADDRDSLWVVDAAAPRMGPVVSHGPKVVQISLSRNKVTRVYPLGSDVVKHESYLNDIRIDTKNDVAYLTDSGEGAIIVLDTRSGEAHRVLDGDESTKPEDGAAIQVNGKPVVTADGKSPRIAADSIALSHDGEYLYYKPLTGKAVYRVKTSALRHGDAGDEVEKVADAFPTDGFWMDADDTLYLSNINESAIYRLPKNGKLEKLLSDKRLVWPDTFSEGPDGSIYITASHINDSPKYNHGKSTRTMPYAVFRFRP
jgi:sugar lactone lactonase YvrE